LYQNSKDSKHNECVLTSCFDEVVEANQTDDDDVDEEEESDNEISSSPTDSSLSTRSNTLATATEQQSVIIDMFNDEDDDEDDDNEEETNDNLLLNQFDSTITSNKQKFETRVQSIEKTKRVEFNDADITEITIKR